VTLDTGALRIRSATAADVPRLESGWRALYVLQREQGMTAVMPPDAFALWSGSMVPGLGRFTNLFLAEASGVLSGFLAARLRRAPAWFGGAAVGFVSEVWVEEAARGAKVGEALVRAAEDWFRAQDAKRVELQVMLANTPARKLYAKLGWRDELLQMATDL
jgi:GNAT superfamily N-acetyltransferase